VERLAPRCATATRRPTAEEMERFRSNLKVAGEKGPPGEPLPLAVQLEMLDADHAHELAKRHARESTICEPLTSRLAKGLDALRDKMYERNVAELQKKIRASEIAQER